MELESAIELLNRIGRIEKELEQCHRDSINYPDSSYINGEVAGLKFALDVLKWKR